MIVVDASVVATALADDDEDGDNVRARLRGERLVAPELIDVEVLAVIRKGFLAGVLDARRSHMVVADLERLRLDRVAHRPLLARAWELRDNLTVYDAMYVALAESLEVTLLTSDGPLSRSWGALSDRAFGAIEVEDSEGTMSSITRDKSGAWRARYRDPNGKQHSRNFPRRRDAELFLTSTEHAKASGAYVDPLLGRITFSAWSREWRAGIVDLRPSTLARDDGYLKRYLQPTFGDLRLAEIDHALVRSWIAELSARGLAPSTVVLAGLLLRKVMATAVAAGRIAASPCTGVKLPRIEREESRFITPSEIIDLTTAMDERYRGLVILGAYGGLRIGEMLGLRAQHLDLLHARVNVAEILVEVSGQLYFGPPKTRAGRRAVPLPRVATGALAEHLTAHPATQADLVFTAPEGGPVRLASWRRRFWKPAVEAAGLSPLRPHDLRHTAVALWIAAGATPREVATRAGHTSVVTVLDRYGHLFPDAADRVNNALDELASSASAGVRAPLRPLSAPQS